MVPYVESLQDTSLLAYPHAQEGLACLDCHELEAVEQVHEEAVAGKPIKRRTVEMEFCFDCHVPNEHTSYEQVIGRTTDYTVSAITVNPHDPHPGLQSDQDDLGPYECNSCHEMHTLSPLIGYCRGCHHAVPLESCRAECHGGVIPEEG